MMRFENYNLPTFNLTGLNFQRTPRTRKLCDVTGCLETGSQYRIYLFFEWQLGFTFLIEVICNRFFTKPHWLL
jgi:hypothetical protein